MAAITDVFKNTPIAVAIMSILYITVVFYAVTLLGSNISTNAYQHPVMETNTLNQVPVYIEHTPAYTVNPRDAIAYLINVMGVTVPKAPTSKTISSVPVGLEGSSQYRTDYINYFVYESVISNYPPAKEFYLIGLITNYPYIMQNTTIRFNITKSGTAPITIQVTVTMVPPLAGNAWDYMKKNATQIYASAYETVAIAQNMSSQGYMIGFYEDYLRYDLTSQSFNLPGIQTVTQGSSTSFAFINQLYTVHYDGNGSALASYEQIYAYMFMLVPHTLSIAKTFITTTVVVTEGGTTTTFTLTTTSDITFNNVDYSLTLAASSAASKRKTALYLASLYYYFIDNYGAAPAEQVYINPDTTYPVGDSEISGADLLRELMYTYKDYFFNKLIYYTYNAAINDLWRGYYFAPDSIKSSFIYYLTMPPAYIPPTAYPLNNLIFYAGHNFGTSTYVIVTNRGTLVYVTTSIYVTGTMTGDITLEFPLENGELYKTISVYLYGTQPTFTSIVSTTAFFRTTSTIMSIVFKKVPLLLRKPLSNTSVITYYVAIVISESMPRVYVPPISGTYVLIPHFTTTKRYMDVQLIESMNGTTNTVYVEVPLIRYYVDSFSSVPITGTVTYGTSPPIIIASNSTSTQQIFINGAIPFYAVTPVEKSGIITTFVTRTITKTLPDGSIVTVATYTGITTVYASNVHVPVFTRYLHVKDPVYFNFESYLKTVSSFYITNTSQSSLWAETYTTAKPVLIGTDVVFSTGAAVNTDPIIFVRNNFYTGGRIEVTISYTTSTTTTTSITSTTSTSTSSAASTTFPVYIIIYTTYYITTYSTVMDNIMLFHGSFIPSYTSNSLSVNTADYYGVMSSYIFGYFQSEMFAAELLETKNIFRYLGVNYAEANNYINVNNLRAQWVLNPNNSITVTFTSYKPIVYTMTYAVVSSGTAIERSIVIRNMITIVGNSTIMFANKERISNNNLAMIFKNPANPVDLFMTILAVNYPIENINNGNSYAKASSTYTLASITFTRTYYTRKNNPYDRYVGVFVTETYVPGRRVPIARLYIQYTRTYVLLNIAAGSNAFIQELFMPVITPMTFVQYYSAWYPPVAYLVSTMPYVSFVPDYPTVVYYLQIYSSFGIVTSATTFTFTLTYKRTTAVPKSIGVTQTLYTTYTSTYTETVYAPITSSIPAMEFEKYEGMFPQGYMFILNIGTTFSTSVNTISEENYVVHTTVSFFAFKNYTMAIAPVSFVTINILYTSGTITGITSISSPVQICPYFVNTNVSPAETLYKMFLFAMIDGKTTTTLSGRTYTLELLFTKEPPYYLVYTMRSLVDEQKLLPVFAWPSLTSGFIASAKEMTFKTNINGTTQTYYVFGFDTDSYTTFGATRINLAYYLYEFPYRFVNVQAMYHYYPLFIAQENYATPVTALPSEITLQAPYNEYNYITHYIYGFTMYNPTQSYFVPSLTLFIIEPGDLYPFTTVSGYSLEGLSKS